MRFSIITATTITACLALNLCENQAETVLLQSPSRSSWRERSRSRPNRNWRDEYNVTRLQRSDAVQSSYADSGQSPCDDKVVQELFDVLQDLVHEQESFRDTIEAKLDEMDELDSLIGALENDV